MKICVYAISKNEQQFVKRWANAVKEADSVYVLDTGSTDNTVELLKKEGVKVSKQMIFPWRFDEARNASLHLVPEDVDVCVCLDLDEVIEPGWRKKIEENWKRDTTRARYNYNWRIEDGKPLVNFYIDKIHKRKGYIWTHPVHEVLTYQEKEENVITIDNLTVNHYPDATKSRSGYLPLLELSVKEAPLDDRNMHYLGREYMYYEKWNESIDTLIKHLHLKTATWKDERCASMRFIARCYTQLNRFDEARMWLDKAIEEAPYLRDPYVERMMLEYQQEKYKDAIIYGEEALKIREKPKSYINEVFSYDGTVEDILSICYFEQKDYEKAYQYVEEAVLQKKEDRILKNKEIIQNWMKG